MKKLTVKDAKVGEVYLTANGNRVTVLKKNSLGQAVVELLVKTQKSERRQFKLLQDDTELKELPVTKK